MGTIKGTSGDDTLTGTSGNDVFAVEQGGDDTISGLAGKDSFRFGASFNANDALDGGTGSDTLLLNGDYSAGVAFAAGTMVDVETIKLGAGFDYDLTTDDATVAAGATLLVNGAKLGAADALTFDGAQETDGRFILEGGAGNDVLTGGAGNDLLRLERGGEDSAHGGGGNDIFQMGRTLDPGDAINGGAGTNKLELDGLSGNHSIVLGADTIQNIEEIDLATGHNYGITENDGNLALGQDLTVNASALGPADTFIFNGAAESDGHFIIKTDLGTYHITGGARTDTFQLGAGFTDQDSVDGGSPGGHIPLKTPEGNDFGINHVALRGDYTGAHALDLGVNALEDIQVVALQEPTTGSTFSYDITSVAGTFGPNSCGFPVTFVCTGFTDSDNFTWRDSGGAGPLIDRVFAWNAGSYNLTFGAADDLFYVGGAWNAANTLDGGAGSDTLALNSEFLNTSLDASYTGANALAFGADQLISVENLGLTGGYSYDITMTDANVAAGQTLTIEADSFSGEAGGTDDEVLSALLAGDTLTFNGAAESDGHFVFDAGAGTYDLIGGRQADSFDFGAHFSADDGIDGGGGSDVLQLAGNYAGGNAIVLGATTLTNVQTIQFAAGHSYAVTTNDATVGGGQTLTVDASALGTGDKLTFNGTAESDGQFIFYSGNGADVLAGGAGADIFHYETVALSGATRDIIKGFDFANDTIAFNAVSAVDPALTTGSLSTASFDGDLTAALAGHLNGDHAVLFTPNAGDLAGDRFLIVDGNGTAGYQAGADLVIQLSGAQDVAGIGTANFVA